MALLWHFDPSNLNYMNTAVKQHKLQFEASELLSYIMAINTLVFTLLDMIMGICK